MYRIKLEKFSKKSINDRIACKIGGFFVVGSRIIFGCD